MSSQVADLSFIDEEQISKIEDLFKIDFPKFPSISSKVLDIIQKAYYEGRIEEEDAYYLVNVTKEELPYLLMAASTLRDEGKGKVLTYSKNVFVPLTQLCRDHCGYCTFKIEPGEGKLFVPPDEVLDMARKGARLGCTEILFVSGDKPELVYEVYREELGKLGYKSTAEYMIEMSKKSLEEGIFPHSNLGLSTPDELLGFRESNPSMGLMLENISDRLLKKGEAHYRCADKVPRQRMKTMEYAGELRIPWTTGILVGIGETWQERIDSLFAIRELSDAFGHIQEIIIQNFSPKEGIDMEKFPPPAFIDMIKTVAISRLIFGRDINLQVPPNLNSETYSHYIYAGINDLGGVSPLTIDYVNPEAPWPQIEKMESEVKSLDYEIRERLPVYPEFISEEFINENVYSMVIEHTDESGFVPLEIN